MLAGMNMLSPLFTRRRPPQSEISISFLHKPSRQDSFAQLCSALLVPCCHVRPANVAFPHNSFTDAILPLQMYPLANSAVQTIPAMRQIAAVEFEFSAVPFLLQRFLPPFHLQLLANSSSSILQELGASQQRTYKRS